MLPKALILAGGKGLELRPLTLNTPKPLLTVGGLPLLLYHVELFKKAGIRDILLSLSYQPRKIRDLFEDGAGIGVLMRFAVESLPVGTAGAFKLTENQIEQTTVVINGDIVTDLKLSDVLRFHRRTAALATIVLVEVPNPGAYGVAEMAADGSIRSFVEKPRDVLPLNRPLASAGIYILEPGVLDLIPPATSFSFERDLFPRLLADDLPFFGYEHDGYWIDIARPSNYLQCNLDLLEGRIQAPRFPGFPLERKTEIPEGVRIDATSIIHPSCVLKPGAQISNSVVGKNCRIEEGSVLEDSVLWGGTRLKRRARVCGAIIGTSCLVGAGATLRKGRILGDKTIVTDFSRL